jgi:predicted AAA+ superfamily ATPase
LFTGLFPPVHDRGLDPVAWFRNYVQTYLERDVRELVAVGDLDTFSRFLSLCAGRSGLLLNLASLATDCGISHTTARRWLSVLRTSFQVVLLQPYHRSFNKRLVKSPKLYFLDTGLLCYLLRIRTPEDLALGPARGAVFETFVVSEIWKRRVHAGEEPDLYFWRDSAGHEVDLVIDTGSASGPIPLEIKSGETVAPDAFAGLDYWNRLAGRPGGPAALVHAGDASFTRRGTVVRPWSGF